MVFGAIVGCAYALGVVLYVLSTPDIGLRCGFTPEIIYVDPASCQGLEKPPHEKDILVQVGKDTKFDPDLTLSQVLLIRALNRENDPGYVRIGSDGKREILVQYASPDHLEETESAWFELGPPRFDELYPSILWLILKLGLFTVGALVFWQRPSDPSASQFFLLCIVTLGAYMGGYHWVRILSQPFLLGFFMVSCVLFPAVSLHFYLVFPRPKPFLSRHPGWSLLAIYGVPLCFLAAIFWEFQKIKGLFGQESWKGVPAAWLNLRVVIFSYMGVASLWYLASVVGLINSYRKAHDQAERNQVKCIMFGSFVALLPIGYTLFMILFVPKDFGSGAATWPMFAASVCFTVAFVVSITRYRLMQVDQIISSGVVYFLISFLAGLVYYGVFFLGMFITGMASPTLSQAFGVSTTALVLMVVLDLARSRLKRALDRRFDRDKHQLDRTLRRMNQAIEQLVDPPTLARRSLQACAELLNVSRGAVYLREGNPPLYRLAGSLGQAPPLPELSAGCPLLEAVQRRGAFTVRSHLPASDPASRQLQFLGGEMAQGLAHEDQLLALLVLGPKKNGSYGLDDLNQMAAFAQLIVLALEGAERHCTIEMLNRDLQSKVEKISEQQKRILALQSQLTRQRESPGPEAVPSAPPPANAAGIIGSSAAARNLMDLVRKVAATHSAVLIRGESGTGKGLLARVLHENSSRASQSFIKVHCAALSSGLLESELFGHVKGAFTSAHRDKVGRFELADRGTLFLDEIGDISLEVQTKLLRVLEEKAFERVGSSEPVQVDVHIITATHQNLEELIRQGRFREDLYYRLKVIDITVPPLRDRAEDIPELAQHFLQVFAQRSGKAVAQIDDDALAVLKAYYWPGNIRELENVLERAVVITEGSILGARDLPAELLQALYQAERDGEEDGDLEPDAVAPRPGIKAERAERARKEKERLVRALAAAKGNKAEAARALGIARSTLVSRLNRHGLS